MSTKNVVSRFSKSLLFLLVSLMMACAIFAVVIVTGNGSFSARAESTSSEADVWDGTADISWYDKSDPQLEYTLTTAEQLAGFAQLVNLGTTFKENTSGATTIKLGCDMDLNGKDGDSWVLSSGIGIVDVTADGYDETKVSLNVKHNWIPIGYDGSKVFSGTIDGQGHTISNMGIDTDKQGVGFVGFLYDAHYFIKNINFDDCYVLCKYQGTDNNYEDCAGIVIGYTAYYYNTPIGVDNIKITNSTVRGENSVGLISGFSNGAHIRDCVVEDSKVERGASTVTFMGGLSGNWNMGSTDVSFNDIARCAVINCTLEIDESTATFYGVFAGVRCKNAGVVCAIKNCYSDAPISEWVENTTGNYSIQNARLTYTDLYVDGGDITEDYYSTINADAVNVTNYKYDTKAESVQIEFRDVPSALKLMMNGTELQPDKYTQNGQSLSVNLEGTIGCLLEVSATVGRVSDLIRVVTDYVYAPDYEFYLDEISLSSAAITTTSDGVSYVEAEESVEGAPVISIRFTEELDPNASVRVVIGENSFVNDGQTVTLGEYSGKVEILLFYSYKGIEYELPARTIYFGLNKLIDNIYMFSGDWVMGELPNVSNVLISPRRDDNSYDSEIFEAQLVVIGLEDIQLNFYINGMNYVNIKSSDGSSLSLYANGGTNTNTSAITTSSFSQIYKKHFDDPTANILTLSCTTYSFSANNNYLNRAYVQMKTKKMNAPDEYEWNIAINGVQKEIPIVDNQTVVFDYFDENDFTFTAPVLGIGDSCTVYRTVGNMEYAGINMEIEQGVFFYHWGVMDSDCSLRFKYSAEGYIDLEFFVTIKFNVGDRTIDDVLIKESTSPIEIVNDEIYPYVFDSTFSTAETPYYIVGNKGIHNSVSYLGIKLHTTGVLYFDYYIGSQDTDVAFWSIGEKATATSTGALVAPSSINTNYGYLNSGELKTYAQSTSKSESAGYLQKSFSAYVTIKLEAGETEKILYFAYSKDATYNFNTDTFGISNIRFYEGEAIIEYTISDLTEGNNVTLTVDGADKNSGDALQKGNSATLTTTVADGYKFYGWVENGEYISHDTTLSFGVMEDRNLTAVIEPVGAYHARIKAAFYATTADALVAAKSGDCIILIENDTVTTNVTLKEGVTLLLPYSITDTTGTLVGDTGNAGINVSWTDADSINKYKYLTLTIDNNVILNICGTLIVGAVQHHPSQYAQGHTSGAYSGIINDGNINIKGGGVLYNYGLIEGSGKLYSEDGAFLYTPFVVNNYCGGSNTYDLYEVGQFPFTQFATINITCAQRVDYGATVMGMTSLYFWGSVTTQDVCLVGKIEDIISDIGSLIWLEKGSYLEISYDSKSIEKVAIDSTTSLSLKDSGVTTIAVHGNITAGSFSLQGFGSKNMVLAIPYTYNFVLKSGASVRILKDYAYKIMPGAIFTVDQGATINIDEGGGLYVYDGLVQGQKSGKRYPSAAELKENGFAQSGMLILDGTLNINGLFAGIVQSTSNTGIINTSASAVLSNIAVKEGSAGYYMDDRAQFTMDARVNTLRGIISLQIGKSYKAFAADNFVLGTFSMDSASGIADNELLVQLNQSMNGVFAEYDTQEDKYVWNIEVYIGEEVKGVNVNIGGSNYTTDENGKIYLTTYYGETHIYYTYDIEMAGYKSFTVGEKFIYILSDIIKSVVLASDNVYERVYDADGNISIDFKLNAIITFYGDVTKTSELTYQSDLATYVNSVTLGCDMVTVTFDEKLYVAPSAFAAYQVQAAAIKDAENIPQAATVAYQSYVALLNNKSSLDRIYATQYLSASINYLDIIVAISIESVIYGDSTANATLTFVDGRSTDDTAKLVSYTGTTSVIGEFVWEGEFLDNKYFVYCNAAQVNGKTISVTVIPKTSVYGDETATLEASVASDALIGDDTKEKVFSLSKQTGDTVGEYDIMVEKLHAGYILDIKNSEDAYTITKRDITINVENHSDIMIQRAVNGMIIDITTQFSNEIHIPALTYNIYDVSDSRVATLNANFVLSASLAIGHYTVEAVTDDSNYNVTSSQKGNLNIIEDNDSYDVSVIYFDKEDKLVTSHIYDGNEIKVEVSVNVKDTQTPAIFSYTVQKIGEDDQIIKAGIYVVNVTVGDVIYNNVSIFTVAKRELVLSWHNLSFTYDGTAVKPSVSATNIVDNDVVVLSVSGEQKNYGEIHTAQAVLGGVDSYNYKLPDVSTKSFEIKKRDITVTVNKATSVYGETLAKLSATATNLLSDEGLDSIVEFGFGEVVVKNKGEYDVVVTCINNNYSVTSYATQGAYTVTAREISVVIDDKSVDYGAVDVPLTASIALGSTLASGDELDDIIKIERGAGTAADTYSISVECVDANYVVQATDANYTIKPLNVSITVADVKSIYGDALANAVLELEGKTGYGETAEDIISVDYNLVDLSKAGNYTITAAEKSNNYRVIIRYSTVDHSLYTVLPRKAVINVGSPSIATGEGSEKITWDELCNELYFTTSNLLVVDESVFEESVKLYVSIDNSELSAANFDELFRRGTHVISARYKANSNYEIEVVNGTLTITKPYVSTNVTRKEFTYTGDVIEAFDYSANIVGYLPSATDKTFKVIYYLRSDPEKNAVELKDAGEYVMQISIVNENAYEWSADAEREYFINVNKKDISENISIIGATDGGYLLMSERIDIFATLINEYAEEDILIRESLSNADGMVGSDIDGYIITDVGKYTYIAEVVDKNLCGKITLIFDVHDAKIAAIAADFVGKQAELGTQPSAADLIALREINNSLTEEQRQALLSFDEDFRAAYEAYCSAWASKVEAVNTDVEVSTKVYKNIAFPLAVAVVAALGAAVFVQLKGRIG